MLAVLLLVLSVGEEEGIYMRKMEKAVATT